MKSFFKKYFALFFIATLAVFAYGEKGIPGSFSDESPDELKKVLELDSKLGIGNDELVIYYVRSDENYDPWALWIWPATGGDGSKMWDYSQKWSVADGIGYMRFKLDGSSSGGYAPVSGDGNVGLIVRQKSDWIKDFDGDRVWNINVSNRAVILSGVETIYAGTEFKPVIVSAELKALDSISIMTSCKYGLDLNGGASGFSVYDGNGRQIDIKSAVNSTSDDLSENFTQYITLNLKNNVKLTDELYVKNENFLGSTSVNNRNLSINLCESAIPSADLTLGAEIKNGTVTFNLWAPTSTDVKVNLYKTANQKNADYIVKMNFNEKNGVWSAVFNTVNADGYFYDYTVSNSKGTSVVLDPYAKSMAAYKNDGTVCRAAIVDMSSSKAMPEGGMTESYVALEKREDAVIYEVSVRDFTISGDSSVRSPKGTYSAFIEKLPYLKSLGITHIQLMPVLNFYNNNETDKSYDDRGSVMGSNYNWGYDPHNYFTPEGWYATDAEDPYCRVRELRELINECHKLGLGVLLDVVYNHMATTEFLDSIVPGYYFRTDANGNLKSNSGCGNDTATERLMMSRLVEDSTSYWVKNYMVDGFRFDLMGLMEADCVERSYRACAKINPDVLFEGEGWKMYDGADGTCGMDQDYMKYTKNIGVFNDEFRDLIKAGGYNETGSGFITGKITSMSALFRNICGNPQNYEVKTPGANIQYLVCHDGLTLHDSISFNCRLDETIPEQKQQIIQRIKLGNLISLTSQGMAFLHAGQERGRSKPNIGLYRNECVGAFVKNSYDSSDNINQFVWTLDDDYENLMEYTKGIILLRQTFNAFRLGDPVLVKRNVHPIDVGEEGLVFAYYIQNEEGIFVLAFNASEIKTKIKTDFNVSRGEVLVDGTHAGIEKISELSGVELSGKTIVLDPLTACVIRLK